MTRHAILPEPRVLFCPRCHGQHEDIGKWATLPHRTHRCLFCEHEWRPAPYTTVGIPVQHEGEPALIVPLAIFKGLDEYSCTLPTGPKPGRYWRRRWPFRSDDREGRQDLCVAIPDDDPELVGLIWRRLLVTEWLAADSLMQAVSR